jgi:hypothetical protein
MALVPNFSASQSLANNSYVTLTDSSTGSDGTITTRKAFFITSTGQYLTTDGLSDTPASETWAYADTSKTWDILPRDMSLSIVVQWLAGATIVYTKTINYVFTLYDYVFLYGLTNQQVSNPALMNDSSYFSNKIQMIVNLNDAENAIEIGDDLTAAQEALDRNYNFIQNSSYYF